MLVSRPQNVTNMIARYLVLRNFKFLRFEHTNSTRKSLKCWFFQICLPLVLCQIEGPVFFCASQTSFWSRSDQFRLFFALCEVFIPSKIAPEKCYVSSFLVRKKWWKSWFFRSFFLLQSSHTFNVLAPKCFLLAIKLVLNDIRCAARFFAHQDRPWTTLQKNIIFT